MRIGRRGQLLALALASAVLVVVLPRMVPGKAFDRGIFVSVAERLRAGDQLYVDVWDNKDPVFFWVLAAGRVLGPIGDITVEVLWMVVACLGCWLIARGAGLSTTTQALMAGAAAPLILTGALYPAGATHLPGLALTLLALGLAMRDRPAAAGVAIGLLVFTKLVIAPLAVLLVLHAGWRRGWAWRAWVRWILAGGLTCFVIVAVLAVRGELVGFLQTQVLNAAYTQAPVLLRGELPAVARLRRGLGLMGLLLSVIVAGALLASALVDRTREGDTLRVRRGWMREAAAIALLTSMALLAVTGMWPHHAQVVYVASLLSVTILASHLESAKAGLPVTATALLVAAIVMAGSAFPGVSGPAPPVTARWAQLSTASPETLALLELGPTGRYARLGSHDDLGHAEGLGGWALVCPRFHVYPWDSPETLGNVLECATNAPVLLVSDAIRARGGWLTSEAWNEFAERTEDLVSSSYACDSFIGGRVCTRVG
jgi:hypothetical protein